jgi:hypothetical protein
MLHLEWGLIARVKAQLDGFDVKAKREVFDRSSLNLSVDFSFML